MAVNEKCDQCGHLISNHFHTQDSIGWWSFCLVDECPCFKDVREEELSDGE